jgi:hypothetical protein
MNFWRTIFGLLRRRSVGIPVLAAAALVGAGLYVVTPARYVSSELFILTTPATGGTISGDPNRPSGLTNPLLNFGTGLQITSGILIQSVNTPDTLATLGDNGQTSLTIDDGRTNPNLMDTTGPYIYVVANSATGAEALAAINATQTWLRNDLLSRQQAVNAPAGTFISLTEVVAPSQPTTTASTKIKYGAAGFVFVLVLGLGFAYFLMRRRIRKAASAAERLTDPEGSAAPMISDDGDAVVPTRHEAAPALPGRHDAATASAGRHQFGGSAKPAHARASGAAALEAAAGVEANLGDIVDASGFPTPQLSSAPSR